MSNKVAVVYSSKSGFTKKYADWITEELGADSFIAKNTKIQDLDTYDTVIYGGSVFASTITGSKLVMNNLDRFNDKKLVLFAVGATPMEEKDKIKEFWEGKLTQDQRQKIGVFYFDGGFDLKKLPFGSRMIMSFMRKVLKGKKNPTEDEKNMLKLFDGSFDHTKKEYINPLIQWVRK